MGKEVNQGKGKESEKNLAMSSGRLSASGEIRFEQSRSPSTGPADQTNTPPMTIIVPQSKAFHSEASLKQYSTWLAALEVAGKNNAISSTEASGLLKTLQSIRNKLIGNKDAKRLLIEQGIISKLVQVMKACEGACVACQRECAVILGSLVTEGDSRVIEEAQNDMVHPLLEIIVRSSMGSNGEATSLLEAATRSLKALCRYPGEHRNAPFEKKYLEAILHVTNGNGTSAVMQNCSQHCLSILSNCCDSTVKQDILMSMGIEGVLIDVLESSTLKNIEIGLDLLAALCRDNFKSTTAISKLSLKGGAALVPFVMEMASSHHKAEVRLLAAVTMTNIFRSQPSSAASLEIARALLPALTQLLDERGQTLVRAPLVIAYLVSTDESLQLAALSCNTVGRLSRLLNEYQQESASKAEYSSATSVGGKRQQLEQACENTLIALAAIASSKDECRKLVIESGVLKVASKLLSSENPALRAASCQCIRSLSRSVKNLRTHLVDACIIDQIISLLDEKEDVTVRTAACATICNMVLDFSPMKSAALDKGAVDQILKLLCHQDASLRLNAVWAMKNLLYMADPKIKETVMSKMTFDLLYNLTRDQDVEVQIQSLNILRNLACGEDSDILRVLQGFGTTRLLSLVLEKLESSRKEIVSQALYIVVNVATGGSLPKGAIMSNALLLEKLHHFIVDSKDEDIRLAAVWSIINLTWPDDEDSEKRVSALRALGFEEALRQLTSKQHISIDLNDRAALALEHFTENFH